MNKTELEKAIELKQAEIAEKEKELENFEIDPYEHEADYRNALDCEGPVSVAGMKFDASRIIEELDPTAYRCGLVDYVDGLEKDDDPKYKELEEELEMLQDELSDLEGELEEMEEEE